MLELSTFIKEHLLIILLLIAGTHSLFVVNSRNTTQHTKTSTMATNDGSGQEDGFVLTPNIPHIEERAMNDADLKKYIDDKVKAAENVVRYDNMKLLENFHDFVHNIMDKSFLGIINYVNIGICCCNISEVGDLLNVVGNISTHLASGGN